MRRILQRLGLAMLLGVTLGVVATQVHAQMATRLWATLAANLPSGTSTPVTCTASGAGCYLDVSVAGGAVGPTGGGTGQTAVVTGDLLYGSAANTWSRLADVATGSVLASGGVGVAPAWSATPSVTSVTTTAAGGLVLGAFGTIKAQSDGVFTLQNTGGTGFGRLQLGGTTNTFTSLRSNSGVLEAMLADLSNYAPFGATAYNLGGVPTFYRTAPTLSSGFGTSPALSSGTLTAFRWNVGTGGVATTGVIATNATATAGWNCSCNPITSNATLTCAQTASSTTTASFASYSRTTGLATAFNASDILAISCTGF